MDLGIRPFIEAAISKDRWLSAEVDTLSIPTVPADKAEEEASIVFYSPSEMILEPNKEFSGGAIALVVSKNVPVDAPPNTLARMHACRQKQVAFNESILLNENKI
jgi:hypothetical protein